MTRNLARKLVAAAERNGGFTVRARTGQSALEGFAFSESPEHERKLGKLTPRALRAYVREHARALRSPSAYLGAWSDGGVWYLDVSTVVGSLDKALDKARAARQLAVFDLGRKVSVAC